MRHDALVAAQRLNTRNYTEGRRIALGLAVTRAREGAGHPWRPSFAEVARISVRSLVKLETGEPVGPQVYEAAARALPGWTVDTPQAILDGAQPPTVVEARSEFSPELQARLDRIERTLGHAAYLEARDLLLHAQKDRDVERGAS